MLSTELMYSASPGTSHQQLHFHNQPCSLGLCII
jgi:hypothetical protein